MNKSEIKIAKITLDLLNKKSWKNLKLDEVKRITKTKDFEKFIKKKVDLLLNLNSYFDFTLSLNIKNLEQSSNKDMIFEIFMMRFDILQENRNVILDIFKSFKNKPQEIIKLLPQILDSVLMMLKFANISSKGIIGQAKIKGCFVIYISTFFVWIKDNNASLEKTMMSLDNNLNRAGKILNFIK